MDLADNHSVSCACCGDDHNIVLPDNFVSLCHDRKLVLFVGSGASTETHRVMPDTFYAEVYSMVGGDEDLSFPELMTVFVDRYSRSELIQLFYKRLQDIDSFSNFSLEITRFHRAVAQIPYLSEIITTNWDSYFESHANAIPLVAGSDFDYWGLPQRKVLKVHGSVLNPGSIVATSEEYEKALQNLRSGALGTVMKNLLLEKTVVFVGYSLRDSDIRQIVETLRSDLGSAARDCYWVHPSLEFEAPLEGATILRTSAAKFIGLLDDALVDAGSLLPRSIYGHAADVRSAAVIAHNRVVEKLDLSKHPLGAYCFSYQDGLLDALDVVARAQSTGKHRMHGQLESQSDIYRFAADNARRAKDYWDYSYLYGYSVGLLATACPETAVRDVPMYFCPGHDEITSFKGLQSVVRTGKETHSAAYDRALRILADYQPGLVIQHTPVLNGPWISSS